MRLMSWRDAATLLALAALACAKIEPPPGGPPDAMPPGLVATVPDSLAVLPDFSGDVEFIFNETVSEGGSPNMGLGTGDLERLVILSPTERVPKVKWKRSRVTVRPAEGWVPGRVYRVQLLPGMMDIRRNKSDSGRVVTFTTGAPLPTTQLTGRVYDWDNARPAVRALIEAVLLPDSLRYRMLADTAGRFDLGPLPHGSYVVYAAIDQNRNMRFDPRESWDSAGVAPDSGAVRELWTFPHDTVGPRLAKTAVVDSLTATLTFSQPLGPTQRFTPEDVRVVLLPDSIAVAVLTLLPKEAHDTLYRPSAPPADSGQPQAAQGPSARPQGGVPDSLRPARKPLFTELYLRVATPWVPKSTYVIEIDTVRNVNRAAAEIRGPLETPEAKPDSTAAPADSAKPGTDTAAPPRPK